MEKMAECIECIEYVDYIGDIGCIVHTGNTQSSTQLYMHTYMYSHTCTCVDVNVHACVYVHKCKYICAGICSICMRMCRCVSAHGCTSGQSRRRTLESHLGEDLHWKS